MQRRQVLGGGLASVVLGAWDARAAASGTTVYSARTVKGVPPGGNAAKISRDLNALRTAALASFPYERIEAAGRDAFDAWRSLKGRGRGVPVVVGGDADLARVAEGFDADRKERKPEDILAAADRLHFPQDLAARRKAEEDAERETTLKWYGKHPDDPGITITEMDASGTQRTLSKTETWQRLLAPAQEPALGEWPDKPDEPSGLSVATDILSARPLDKVHIVMLPAKDWTEVPAFLHWGGWNACPPPEFHVAAFRSWRERYGAELVGMSGEVLNLTVARKPANRDDALKLAYEQYLYCSDIVDQGTQALRPLAMDLMTSDWWYFWWD